MKRMLRYTVWVFFSLSLLVSGLNASAIDDGDLPQSIHNFVKGINEKSFAVLKSSLASDFSIEGVPTSLNDMILRQLVSENMPPFIAYKGKSIQKQSGKTVYTVTLATNYYIFDFRFETDPKEMITNTSLLSREIPKSLMQTNGKLQDFVEIPVRVVHGLTLIKCELNGVEGDFLLRSSINNLTINNRVIDAGMQATKTGHTEIGLVTLKKFSFKGATYTNIDAICKDLSSLESDFGLEIMGIVGISVLEAFEAHYDYHNSKIMLYRLNSDGLIAGEVKAIEPRQKLKMEQKGSQMLVKVNLGKKNLKLAFDSGLQKNILNQTLSKKLEKVSSVRDPETVLIGDLQAIEVAVQNVSANKVGKTDLGAMDCVYADLSAMIRKTGTKFDGYLGLPFFQNQKISVNYRSATLGVF